MVSLSFAPLRYLHCVWCLRGVRCCCLFALRCHRLVPSLARSPMLSPLSSSQRRRPRATCHPRARVVCSVRLHFLLTVTRDSVLQCGGLIAAEAGVLDIARPAGRARGLPLGLPQRLILLMISFQPIVNSPVIRPYRTLRGQCFRFRLRPVIASNPLTRPRISGGWLWNSRPSRSGLRVSDPLPPRNVVACPNFSHPGRNRSQYESVGRVSSFIFFSANTPRAFSPSISISPSACHSLCTTLSCTASTLPRDTVINDALPVCTRNDYESLWLCACKPGRKYTSPREHPTCNGPCRIRNSTDKFAVAVQHQWA